LSWVRCCDHALKLLNTICKQKQFVMRQRMEAVMSFVSGEADARDRVGSDCRCQCEISSAAITKRTWVHYTVHEIQIYKLIKC